MGEITWREKIAVSTTRGLDSYLKFSGVSPIDFHNKIVLNAGPGKDNLQQELCDRFGVSCKVVNLDLAYIPERKSWLWYLAGKIPRSAFPDLPVRGDMKRLPFLNDSFDIAFANYSLLCLSTAGNKRGIKELLRVTKGHIYIDPIPVHMVDNTSLKSLFKDRLKKEDREFVVQAHNSGIVVSR